MITIPHTGAVEHDGVVQQRAVAVRRVGHPLDQLAEQRDVVDVDLRVLLDVVRVELVMGHTVVRLRHPDVRVGAAAQLAGHLEATHPGDIGLIGQGQHVEQHLHVRVVRIGHTGRLVRGWKRCRGTVLLGALDPAFDISHRIQVLLYHVAVTLPQPALELVNALHDRVENAAVGLHLGQPCFHASAVAEEPLEHHTRVALVGQRLGRSAPGRGVLVCAAVAVLTVADAEVRLGGQL